MKNKTIITIARQFGSGGREIGEKLANKLEIPYYDKSIIHLAAKESGIAEDLFDYADETRSHSFWTAGVSNTSIYGNQISVFHDMPMNDRLFLIQSNIIKKLAESGSGVIVGRCADYILGNEKNIVSIFIHSSAQDRLDRIIHNYNIPKEDAKDIMIKTDKRRAAYYNYYSGEKWGRADNYDLSINSGAVGIEGAVDLIIKFAELKLEGQRLPIDKEHP